MGRNIKGEFDANAVREVLKKLGFSYDGNTGGHEVWTNSTGRRVTPVLRHGTVSRGSLYALGHQLETVGVLSERRKITQMLRKGHS